MRLRTLSIDAQKCTACRVCELVCSYKHEGAFAPSLSRIRVVRLHEKGLNVPVVCVNCARPACVEVCPTGAVRIDRNLSVVYIEEEECIGCGECVTACPFGAADFNEEKGVAFICDLCGGEPACVSNCLYGALRFEPVGGVAQRKRRATAQLYAVGGDVR